MVINRINEILISRERIAVQKANIHRLLGYGTDNTDEHVDEIIDTCISEAARVFSPTGAFVIVKNDGIILSGGILLIQGQKLFVGKIIAAQLRKAEFIAFFICTVGKDVELLAKKNNRQADYLEGYIFDIVGSEAAEETAEVVQQEIKAAALKENLHITNRFSPGYCNWDVSEQFKLFSYFPDGQCGIKLTPSALMDPIKSVSGIIGIGSKVEFKPYTCSFCDDEKCIYRNRKSHLITRGPCQG